MASRKVMIAAIEASRTGARVSAMNRKAEPVKENLSAALNIRTGRGVDQPVTVKREIRSRKRPIAGTLGTMSRIVPLLLILIMLMLVLKMNL